MSVDPLRVVWDALKAAGCPPRGSERDFRAPCPAHRGENATALHVWEGAEGKAMLKCFCDCENGQVVEALRLDWRDLFADSDQPRAPWGTASLGEAARLLPGEEDVQRWQNNLLRDEAVLGRIFELKGWPRDALAALDVGLRADRLTIPVRSLDGNLVNVLRYWPEAKPKMIATRGAPRVPFYALIDDSGPVWIVEGETDTVTMVALGLSVIGAPGAGTGPRAGWLDVTRGRVVYVIFDCDDPGRRAAQRWAQASLDIGAAEVRVIDLKGPDGYDVGDLLREHRDDPGQARRILLELAARAPAWEPEPGPEPKLQPGRQLLTGADLLNLPDAIPAVWGTGQRVAWAEGERLLVCAPQGVGKSVLAQHLALARAGIGPAHVLGMPVHDDGRKVLYLAMDRPPQAARSIRRMLRSADHAELERLLWWKGAAPVNLVADPESLLKWVTSFGDVGTLIVDSVKDLAAGLSKDEVGSAVDHALRRLSLADIETLALHHPRKQATEKGGSPAKPSSLDEVYGSVWITGGSGSVLLLWGEAGAVKVELSTLKPVADEIGPFSVVHDKATGAISAKVKPSVVELVDRSGTGGMSAREIALALDYGDTRAGAEKARRKLDQEVEAGRLERENGTSRIPARWYSPRNESVTSRDQSVTWSRETSRGSRIGSTPAHADVHADHKRGARAVVPSQPPVGGEGPGQRDLARDQPRDLARDPADALREEAKRELGAVEIDGQDNPTRGER